jgi:sRNA-binding carbon storage regulator CsrA
MLLRTLKLGDSVSLNGTRIVILGIGKTTVRVGIDAKGLKVTFDRPKKNGGGK